MQLSKPVYESLPWGYALAGAALIAISHRLHSGLLASLLLLGGVLGVVAGAVIWLRRRDFRTTRAEYRAHEGQPLIDADDERRSPEKP
jgi:uncharacterized iron-regulated membrane protein